MSTGRTPRSDWSIKSIKKAQACLNRSCGKDDDCKEQIEKLKALMLLVQNRAIPPYGYTKDCLSFDDDKLNRLHDLASRIVKKAQEEQEDGKSDHSSCKSSKACNDREPEPEDEAQIKDAHRLLTQEIDRLAKDLEHDYGLKSATRPSSSQLLLLEGVPSICLEQQHLTVQLVNAVIWSTLLQSVFSSPFSCFGSYGHEFCNKCLCLFTKEQNGLWPSPSRELELWRSITVETLLKKSLDNSEISGAYPLDQDLVRSISREKEQAIEGIATDLKRFFGGSDVQAGKTRPIVDMAVKLASLMFKQKCRLGLLVFPHGEADLGDKVMIVQGTSRGSRVGFMTVPGIYREGDWQGENFDVRSTILPAQIVTEAEVHAQGNTRKQRDGLPNEDTREAQSTEAPAARRPRGRPRKHPRPEPDAPKTRRRRKVSHRNVRRRPVTNTSLPSGYVPAGHSPLSDQRGGHLHDESPHTCQTQNAEISTLESDDKLLRPVRRYLQDQYVQDQQEPHQLIQSLDQGQYIREQHPQGMHDQGPYVQDQFRWKPYGYGSYDNGNHDQISYSQSHHGPIHHDQLRSGLRQFDQTLQDQVPHYQAPQSYAHLGLGQQIPSPVGQEQLFPTGDTFTPASFPQLTLDQSQPSLLTPGVGFLHEKELGSPQTYDPLMSLFLTGFKGPSASGNMEVGVGQDADMSLGFGNDNMSFDIGTNHVTAFADNISPDLYWRNDGTVDPRDLMLDSGIA